MSLASKRKAQSALSLHRRFFLSFSGALLIFIVAMSYILIDSYRVGLRANVYERLQAHLYSFLSVSDEISPGELSVPEEPYVDTRFNQTDSGLSALIYDETESLIWRSISTGYNQYSEQIILPSSFSDVATMQDVTLIGKEFFQFHIVIEWESENAEISLYHFLILEDKENFNGIVKAYRTQLLTWLAALSATLLIVLLLVLRWSMTPIRRVAQELSSVEKGLSDKLSSNYPKELTLLTANINHFISNERHQSKRHKETLANLAHSLKTPLAVVQTALQNNAEEKALKEIVSEQTRRMNQIVSHQLQRATFGKQIMMKRLDAAPIVQRICDGLAKVYPTKKITLNHANAEHFIRINEGDLYEACGNLIDNACKFSKSQVSVSIIEAVKDAPETHILIEDDGEGISESVRDTVMARGKRLDESVEGQGIGMSVVKEIVNAYDAKMVIETSSLGGASICLIFKS